jgi:hypothetical protein
MQQPKGYVKLGTKHLVYKLRKNNLLGHGMDE